MKAKAYPFLCAAALAAVVFIAHTQTVNLGSGPWTGYGGDFTFNRTSYFSLLFQSNIVATPRWQTSQPLPLPLDKAVKIARGELHKLVPDDRQWKLTSIELESLAVRAPSADDAWYYRIRFEPTARARLQGPNPPPYLDNVQIAVDFSGRPGVLLSREELLK